MARNMNRGQQRYMKEFMEQLLDVVNNDTRSIKELAVDAGVCPSTIGHWVTGVTRTPRTDTIIKVLWTLGYKLEFTITAA